MADALELMGVINRAVSAGESGPPIVDAINTLCIHLKSFGQQLEGTNSKALDAVFVSLRQAACRDAGQLGRALRLRLMHLIELRAMNWRPSLSHSAYYSKHVDQPTVVVPSAPPPPLPLLPLLPPIMPSPHLRSPSLPIDLPIPIPSPTFYLLPALANMGIFPFLPHPQMDLRPPKKPSKPVIREEMVIRNADSGKLMGVKGRRVALVEQLSGSVISFQKVTDPKSKQRTLTITATEEESVARAKSLIEETIRRNASPSPSEGPLVYSREEIMALSSHSSLSSREAIEEVAPEILRPPLSHLSNTVS